MILSAVMARWMLVLLAATGAASPVALTQPQSVTELPSDAELVRATVANEVDAANNASVKHLFRSYKKTSQGSQTRIYVETREAMAGMTIAYNDKPLSPEQLQGEESRLQGLVNNREQMRRKQKQEKEEAQHTLSIVKALPDAFIYDRDGEEMGTSSLGREGMPLIRLKFHPNPAFRPPSHVEDVLVGMSGFLLVDPAVRRIARIDGTLFRDVTFGWGILGHLDKGGHFFVEQHDLGDGSWEICHMRLEFTGKIFFFKSISIKSDEVLNNFRQVPADITFAQGVEMLKAEEVRLAQNAGQTAHAEGTRP